MAARLVNSQSACHSVQLVRYIGDGHSIEYPPGTRLYDAWHVGVQGSVVSVSTLRSR